jgi:hypothetical protein
VNSFEDLDDDPQRRKKRMTRNHVDDSFLVFPATHITSHTDRRRGGREGRQPVKLLKHSGACFHKSHTEQPR